MNHTESLIRDRIVKTIYQKAESITSRVVKRKKPVFDWDTRLDDILTSRWFGFPIMFLLLGAIFWLTIIGANYPSQLLAKFLFWGQDQITVVFQWFGAPQWLHDFLVLGVYRTLAWVVSVMLPPMAIFFPLFALLEDFGYLPRVALNLDRLFKLAGTHGKQALSMCMGFGCNAAGVIACRIIESPRERLIAILTNNFVPCNGRFPTLIALAFIFMGGMISSIVTSLTVMSIVLIGIVVTLFTSWFLSKTLLKGIPSTFTLELPPYRIPQIGRTIIRSILDRTIVVLIRAILVAAPAGGIVWVMANVHHGGKSILTHGGSLLQPFGQALGMDGFILLSFIIGLPANEIVLPILIMSYLSASSMTEPDSLQALKMLLVDNQGWTWLTAFCTMLFSLLHFPCGTTLFTIWRETKSAKWTVLAIIIPLVIASLVCFMVNWTVRTLGLI